MNNDLIYKQEAPTSIRCGNMSQVFCGHKMWPQMVYLLIEDICHWDYPIDEYIAYHII